MDHSWLPCWLLCWLPGDGAPEVILDQCLRVKTLFTHFHMNVGDIIKTETPINSRYALKQVEVVCCLCGAFRDTDVWLFLNTRRMWLSVRLFLIVFLLKNKSLKTVYFVSICRSSFVKVGSPHLELVNACTYNLQPSNGRCGIQIYFSKSRNMFIK